MRAATRAAHERLDASLDVVDHPWDLDRHRRWLELIHGLLAPLERGLAAWAAHDPEFPDVAARARADLVLADLATLDALGARDAPDPRELPECPDVPQVLDRAGALGVVYVLDGSTLGGRVIRNAVVAAGVPDAACTSLTGRDGAGRRWRETMAALDAVADADVPRVAASATATFAAFETWLAPLRRTP